MQPKTCENAHKFHTFYICIFSTCFSRVNSALKRRIYLSPHIGRRWKIICCGCCCRSVFMWCMQIWQQIWQRICQRISSSMAATQNVLRLRIDPVHVMTYRCGRIVSRPVACVRSRLPLRLLRVWSSPHALPSAHVRCNFKGLWAPPICISVQSQQSVLI